MQWKPVTIVPAPLPQNRWGYPEPSPDEFRSLRGFLLFGLFFLSTIFPLAGQTPDWQLRIFDFEEGLTHRNVFRVRQDSTGFLWIATVNGLNRYDGYEFVPYNSLEQPGLLAQDVVSELYCDPQNRIWAGHPNFLTCLERGGESSEILTINTESLDRGAEQTPSYIQIDADGNIWMSAFAEKHSHAYLKCYSPAGELLFEKQLEGRYEKHPLIIRGSNLYVCGAQNELWRLDLEAGDMETYSFPFRSNDPAATRIVELQLTPANEILVLLANGELYFKEPGARQFRLHPLTTNLPVEGPFRTFHYSEKTGLWLASVSALLHFDRQVGAWRDFHADIRKQVRHDPDYRQIFVDASGVVWVASDFGLIKIVQDDEFFRTFLSGGSSYCSSGFCSMRGMAESPEGILYATYYNSIHRLDLSTGELEPLFPDNEFVNPPFGLVWHRDALYTGNGIRIDPESGKVDTLFRRELADQGHPVVGPEGGLWIGYKKELFYQGPTAERPEPLRDRRDSVVTLAHDITYLHWGARSGSLWIGTREGGVYLLKPDSRRPEPFLHTENGLTHNRVLALYEDGRGRLWIATAAGLHRKDLVSDKLRIWTTDQGMPNDFINGILPEGDSCLWVSTDFGLARLSENSGRVSVFFREDGLPANEFNRISFHKTRDGRLFFGGLNGLVAFEPDPSFVWERNRRNAPLLLTRFSKFDGDIDSMVSVPVESLRPEPIRLSWRDKFFTFGFALADYGNPRENRYSYRLRGYETDWSEPTRIPQARYNNIPAGEYVFEVRAAAGNDTWSPEILTVPLRIEQAYYKSLWFIGLCGLLLAALIYGFMRYRIYTIRQREKYLEKQVMVRTQELAAEKQKSDDLLLNILPAETAEELKKNGSAKAQRFDAVTVMFSDFVGFTSIAEKLPPEKLVKEIDYCFRAFDQIIEKHGLEKIKTIGDAYMCVGGMRGVGAQGAVGVVRAALEMQAFLADIAQERSRQGLPHFEARMGIHTGPVVAGIVGIKKFAYDIWGDTVNVAARLENKGTAGRVNISRSTYEAVKNDFACTYRGKIKAKNKGQIDMYFVEHLIAEPS